MARETNPAPVAAEHGAKGVVVTDKTFSTIAAATRAPIHIEPSTIYAARATDSYFLHVNPTTGIERRLTTEDVAIGLLYLTVSVGRDFEYTKTWNIYFDAIEQPFPVRPRGLGWEMLSADASAYTVWCRLKVVGNAQHK